MNVFNVHSNKAPISGKLLTNGIFLENFLMPPYQKHL